MSDDDTRQAEPGDEPETTSVPTSAAPTPELAWSADDGDDESQRRSWPRTAALATGIVAAGAAIGAGLWLAVPGFKTTVTNHVVPQHSTTTTVAAAPSTTPPTVTVVKPSVPPVLSADDQRLLYQLRSVEGYEADNPALVVAHAHRYCELIQQGFSGYQAWQGVVSESNNDVGMHLTIPRPLLGAARTPTEMAWNILAADASTVYPNCSELPPPAPATTQRYKDGDGMPPTTTTQLQLDPNHPELPPPGYGGSNY